MKLADNVISSHAFLAAVAALSAFVAFVACVGPANAPVPCQVDCHDGTCCPFNTSCDNNVPGDKRCRAEDPWPYGVGVRKDGGK